MNDRHPDTETLAAYFEGRLGSEASVHVAEHLPACDSCRDDAIAVADLDRRLVSVRSGDHLPYEALEELAEGRPGDGEWRSHLEACTSCAAALEDLREFAGAVRVRRRRQWVGRMVAIAAALIIVLGVVLVATSREPNERVPQLPQERTAALPNPVPSSADQPVVLLRDRSGDIRLRADGTIEGIPGSPATQRRVATLLREFRFEQAAPIAGLTVPPDSLRGGAEESGNGRLLEPVGVVVRTARPTFAWEAKTTAPVTIELYDEHYDLVASATVRGASRWQPAQPLARGRTYSWQLVFEDANLQPARFHVVGEAAAQEIADAEGTGSRIVLAEVLVRHGLTREARRELEALGTANANSPIPAKLLRALDR